MDDPGRPTLAQQSPPDRRSAETTSRTAAATVAHAAPASVSGTARASQADFTFSIGDLDASILRVTSFDGTEGLSELFEFSVELSSDAADLDLEAQLGQNCLLQIRGAGDAAQPALRNVHGIAYRIERTGGGSRLTHYRISIVPQHWYLTKRHASRIFQKHNCEDMSVPGIVRKVLLEAGLPEDSFRFVLSAGHEPRDYVVQYRESDFAFISRLMEEEGIYYFFEHSHAGHCMVIGNGDAACKVDPAAPKAAFREATGLAADSPHVFDLQERREIQTGAVSLDDFDFKRPPTELRAEAAAKRFSTLKTADFPGNYVDHRIGQRFAQIRLEEQQTGAHTLELRATVRTFKPGFRFALLEHPDDRLNGEYLVTRVHHRGQQSQSAEAEALFAPQQQYVAHAGVLPSKIQFRPARKTPRPFVRGSQTAIVVGPEAEEIYTDTYGRVKVQFHWDQQGGYDENSSCWIRVSQGLAGGSYGVMFLPRVGQEVIVDFLEGDPDRPIITGRVYNNDHMPPYALPQDKAISTIRTCSTKGAGGGNEIRFDDTKKSEQLFLHAQNALHIRTRGSRCESTGGDVHRTVGRNSHELVKEKKHTIVKLDLMEEINGSKNLKVDGDVREFFQGKQTTYVDKQYNLLNSGGIWLGSDTSITLWCKGNFIKLDAAGVTIVGKLVNINSGGSADFAEPAAPDVAEEPKPAATTRFGHNTRYSGQPQEPAESQEEQETSWIEIELVDEAGRPCPSEPFEIRTPDGKTIEGALDQKGMARVLLARPGACEICFPNLDAAAWERI